MVYNSLDILPIKVFYKILETNDFTLLGKTKKYEELWLKLIGKTENAENLWLKLYEEYNKLNPDKNFDKVFDISKNIEMCLTGYEAVQIAISCLRVKKDDRLIEMLRSRNYKITDDNYDEDLDRIHLQSDSLLRRVKRFKAQLPKESNNKVTIDEVLGSYSAILGYDLGDYNTISVTKFLAVKKQVEIKIK